MEWGLKNKYIVFKKTKDKWSVYFKQYQFVDNECKPIERFIPYKSFILDFPNEQGGKELEDIFHERVFDYPKPVGLMKYLISLMEKKNAIVLDFMAGTGTTGQAVLELNKEDGGSRQFILCTNNENRICTDVCYPRLKRVIEGYTDRKGRRVEGFGGNLKYFRTGFVPAARTDQNKKRLTDQSAEMLCVREGTFDLVSERKGFRVFKNDDHYTGIIYNQLAIEDFKRAVAKVKKPIHVYVFSLGDEDFSPEFEDMKNRVEVCPIPDAILRTYDKIW